MKAYLLIGAALASSLVGTASAGPSDAFETRQQAVTYADLNLSNYDDVQVLYGRIVLAARNVCGRNSALPMESLVSIWRCREWTIDRAVEDVDASLLTSYRTLQRGVAPDVTTLAGNDESSELRSRE